MLIWVINVNDAAKIAVRSYLHDARGRIPIRAR